MSPIDPSKLKEALDDFVEKETLVKEEIKLVEQQIEELHARTVACNEHLQLVGKDRQKVLDIANRYTANPISSLASPIITAPPAATAKPTPGKTETPVAAIKPAVKATESKPAPEATAPAKPETAKAATPVTSEKPAVAPIKAPPSTPAKTPPAAKAGDTKEAAKEPEKEPPAPEPEDDTVKNINEALRGLFR